MAGSIIADRLIEFSGNIKQAVFRTDHRQVRPHAFAEIDIAHNFPRRQIDDHKIGAVSARLSDPGVSIDRHVGEFSVGRRRDFVPGYAALGYLRHLLPGDRIDEAQTVVALIGHQYQSTGLSP